MSKNECEIIKNFLYDIQLDNGRFKFSKSSFNLNPIDSTSLALDLIKMFSLEWDFNPSINLLLKHQNSKTGFFFEPNTDILLSNNPHPRAKEMAGTYLGFQVAGCLDAYNTLPKYPFSFWNKLYTRETLHDYFSQMPWAKSPWGAGGWVDSISTMIKMNEQMGLEISTKQNEWIFEFLEKKQNISNGFWGEQNIQGLAGLINGAYHLIRGTYFLYNKEVPKAELILDNIIEYINTENLIISSKGEACHDLDCWYLTYKLLKQTNGYRIEEFRSIAIKRLETINSNSSSRLLWGFFLNQCQDNHNHIDISKKENEADIQGTIFYLTAVKSLNKIIDDSKTISWKFSYTHG